MALTAVECGQARAGFSASEPADALERRRLDVLGMYEILDTEPELAFDRIVDLAQALFDTPIALLTLLDSRRQWFKARIGLDLVDTPREIAFCHHAIRDDGVMVVADARADARFASNPLVTDGPRIRFYAGAPLVTPCGARLGTVCVISNEPRGDFSDIDRQRLRALAAVAASELELRLQTNEARRFAEQKALLVQEVEHRVGCSLRLVSLVLEARACQASDRHVRQAFLEAVDRIAGLETLHQQLSEHGGTFGDDARAFLLALLGSVQDAILDGGNERTITLLADDDRLALPADALTRLGMVVTELVVNAIKHGHGAITVRVVRRGTGFEISVSDEGQGLAPHRKAMSLREGPGLRIVASLAVPGGVVVDPFHPGRVVVRMAAHLRPGHGL